MGEKEDDDEEGRRTGEGRGVGVRPRRTGPAEGRRASEEERVGTNDGRAKEVGGEEEGSPIMTPAPEGEAWGETFGRQQG